MLNKFWAHLHHPRSEEELSLLAFMIRKSGSVKSLYDGVFPRQKAEAGIF
jgi:hypothetical protein